MNWRAGVIATATCGAVPLFRPVQNCTLLASKAGRLHFLAILAPVQPTEGNDDLIDTTVR